MEVSLAYFVYDLLVCLVIDPEPVGLVHHLCTIAGLAVGVLQGKVRTTLPVSCASTTRATHLLPRLGQCGTELVACLLLMEVSNPSMHLNQLLKELGASGSPLATANQLVFALLFFLCRLCVGPLVVHAAVTSTTTPTVVKAGGLGILVVSLVWFRKVRASARQCTGVRRCPSHAHPLIGRVATRLWLSPCTRRASPGLKPRSGEQPSG